ncbi:MAG: ATP-binding cassette domain-containing protein, partial [Thermoleophilum sp.]|nr:ATP-binding cassette domain-containing protein [Thermoleophilum sp.]
MSDHPTSAPALEIERATKSFVVSRHQFSTLKERALHPLQAREVQRRTVLRDISVQVARGEFFGIVGRNGSGKSTLLKCIAGIYQLDRGRIRVYGRLAPFIELGVGFNYELTARDNILTNAVMLGLSRREARRRFDAIIDFAELRDFVDLKLKNYSSGMAVRLAFSVAIQVDADILLVDEVLAVGDAAFQQKCFAEFRRMRREGRTVLFVTHDMASLTRFCERAMLIEGGRCIELGPAEVVARRYNEVNFGRLEDSQLATPGQHLKAVWFEDEDGRRTTHTEQGGQIAVCCEISPPPHDESGGPLALKVTLRNDVRHTIVVLDTHWERRSAYRAMIGGKAMEAIEVSIIQNPSASSARVVPAVMKVIRQIEKDHPGIKFTVAYDNAHFEGILFHNMLEELLVAIVLTGN